MRVDVLERRVGGVGGVGRAGLYLQGNLGELWIF
jgi:hypothetical protein